ncbi:hypothetical protein [Gordonia sp. NPDC003950]
MQPFVGNDYRKRVLAAVERRGGVDESDSFELYDLPLEQAADLTDDAVRMRLDEVWAFWQKHRDHPKYRVLVEQLVAEHPQRSAPLRESASRLAEARMITDRRRRRDEDRYALLDKAIERLIGRYGGIPTSKRGGLDEIGAMGGLSADEVATRVRRHRVIDDSPAAPPETTAPAAPALSAHRLAQITELLAEFSRRGSGPASHTLLAVLGLDTDDATNLTEITLRAEALQSRARELPAGRMRALIDELLITINDVLLGGPALADAYLASVRESVGAHLRPRIRAAILVEDRLHPDDRQYMLEEARDLGLGTRDARRLIDDITREFGGEVDTAGETPPPPPTPTQPAPTPTPTPTPPQGDWQRSLRSARQALRKGNLDDARTRCDQARSFAGDDDAARRQIEAVADEIARASRAPAAPTPVTPSAPQPNPADVSPTPPTAAPDTTPAPPSNVHEAFANGAVVVAWEPSPTPGATYRVTRVDRTGRRQVVGRTATTELEDGGTRPSEGLPSYEVTASVDGMHSAPAVSSARAPEDRSANSPAPAHTAPTTRTPPSRIPPPPAPPSPTPPPAPTADLPDITDVAVTGDLLTFTWPAGVTEVMVVIRSDAPPENPRDPAAVSKKVTNTRYEIDGGYRIPGSAARPAHVAVAACRRVSPETLTVAAHFGPAARARL